MVCVRALLLTLMPLAVAIGKDGWNDSGDASADEQIRLTFWVRSTHTHELKEILHRVSDPSSPDYGHYLSKADVDALTRPTKEHVAAVKGALSDYQVKSSNDDAVIWADVPISFAQKLLGGNFVRFCHAAPHDGSHPICVLRNPTAQVPAYLRSACDIISPIDDPFPPVHPLPGPIIEPVAHKQQPLFMSLATKQDEKAGCCFSLGYGAMNRPCCLETTRVVDKSSCRLGIRIGGASGFVDGACPTSAQEAADLITPLHKETSTSAEVAAEQTEEKQAPQSSPHPEAQNTLTAGCCFSFGFGDYMEPCCLRTSSVDDVAKCPVQKRLGGGSGYSVGKCPANADEAAAIAKKRKAAAAEVAARPQPTANVNSTSTLLLILSIAACAGLIGGAAVAAQRRPDWRRTPFLGTDGEE